MINLPDLLDSTAIRITADVIENTGVWHDVTGNDSRQSSVWKKVCQALGIKPDSQFKFLDNGSQAWVFTVPALNGKVVKFTYDDTDAKALNLLKQHPDKSFVNVYGVWQIPIVGDRDVKAVWMVLAERIPHKLDSRYKHFANSWDVSNEINEESVERFKSDIESGDWDPEVSEQAKLDPESWNVFLDWLDSIASWAQHNSVVIRDIMSDNVMQRGSDELVLIDLGYGDVDSSSPIDQLR